MSKILVVSHRTFVRRKLIDICTTNVKIDKDKLFNIQDDQKLAEVLVLLCPFTETSQYATTFKNRLNINDNIEDQYPELFNNDELTDDEFEEAKLQFLREVVILLNLLHTNKDADFFGSPLSCDESSGICTLPQNKNKVICVYSRNEFTQIFCFEKLALLKIFASVHDSKNPINPITGMYFEESEALRIKKLYPIPIKLLRYNLVN